MTLITVMDEVMAILNERERKVLRLRFGLEDGRSRTLEEVGKEFNVTGEWIRQIEDKALRKLRRPSRVGRLHWLTVEAEERRQSGLKGYITLQAAIFWTDVDDFYRGYGLWCFLPQPTERHCKVCGRGLTEQDSYKHLCESCRRVPVTCEVCGRTVQRGRCNVLAAAARDAQHQFCSKHCQGVWLGSNYGIARKGGRPCAIADRR